jgi:hypothetical protein
VPDEGGGRGFRGRKGSARGGGDGEETGPATVTASAGGCAEISRGTGFWCAEQGRTREHRATTVTETGRSSAAR